MYENAVIHVHKVRRYIMKCPRCGFDNPDYLEYCRNCSAELPANKGENAKPAWGFVKAPKWSEPDFSADSVSEDDIPEDFVSETETFRKQREAERRAAAEAAASALPEETAE